jgi:hypothetical protein
MDRKSHSAIGKEHELQIQTLSGDSFAITDWGLAKNLKELVAEQHPDLGTPCVYFFLSVRWRVPFQAFAEWKCSQPYSQPYSQRYPQPY